MKLQTICQRLVISAQLHGLDLWGKFSPFLSLSQLGDANATNGLGKNGYLISISHFHIRIWHNIIKKWPTTNKINNEIKSTVQVSAKIRVQIFFACANMYCGKP